MEKQAELKADTIETSSLYVEGYSASSSSTKKLPARKKKISPQQSRQKQSHSSYTDSHTAENVYILEASQNTPLPIDFSLEGVTLRRNYEQLLFYFQNGVTVKVPNFFSFALLPDVLFGGAVLYTGEEFLSLFAPLVYKEYLFQLRNNSHKGIAMQLEKGIFQYHPTKNTSLETLDDKVRSSFWTSLEIDPSFVAAWEEDSIPHKTQALQPIVVQLPSAAMHTPSNPVTHEESAEFVEDFTPLHTAEDCTPYTRTINIISRSELPSDALNAFVSDILYKGKQQIINTVWELAHGSASLDIEGNITYTPSLLTLRTYSAPYIESFQCTLKTEQGTLISFTVSLLLQYQRKHWMMQVLPAIDITTSTQLTALTLLASIQNPLQGDFLYFNIPLPEDITCTQDTSTQFCLTTLHTLDAVQTYMDAICCSIENTTSVRYVTTTVQGVLNGVTYQKQCFFCIEPSDAQEEYPLLETKSIDSIPDIKQYPVVHNTTYALSGSLYQNTLLEQTFENTHPRVTRIVAEGKSKPVGYEWETPYATCTITEEGSFVYTVKEEYRTHNFEKPVQEIFSCTLLDAAQHIYAVTLAIEILTCDNVLLLRRMDNYEVLLKEQPSQQHALTFTATLLNPAPQDTLYIDDSVLQQNTTLEQMDSNLFSLYNCESLALCEKYTNAVLLHIPEGTVLHTRYVLVGIEGYENGIYNTLQHIYTIEPKDNCQYYYIAHSLEDIYNTAEDIPQETAQQTVEENSLAEETISGKDSQAPLFIQQDSEGWLYDADETWEPEDSEELTELTTEENTEDYTQTTEAIPVESLEPITPSEETIHDTQHFVDAPLDENRVYYQLTAEEALQMQRTATGDTRITGTHKEGIELVGDWKKITQKPIYKDGAFYQYFEARCDTSVVPVYFAIPLDIRTAS